MSREKQPYLVNPPVLNPFEVLRVPSRRVVAETDKKGRFKRVKSLSKSVHRKARKVSRKIGVSLFETSVEKRRKVTKSRKLHGAAKAAFLKRMAAGRKHHSVRRTSAADRFTYSALKKAAGLKNPVMLVNPKRRISMRTKRTHRNPIQKFFKNGQMSSAANLALNGAVLVGGMLGSNYLMDKAGEKVAFLAKPWGKVAGHAGLAIAIYLIGTKVKKIPTRVVEMLALGAMVPAVMDTYHILRGGAALPAPAAVQQVSYDGQELDAYVPPSGMGAYVPASGLGDSYGQSY